MSRAASFGPPADEAELGALLDIQTLAFLGTPNAERRAERMSRAVVSDMRVVRRAGQVAGGLSILRIGQWFGGRQVPMAGIAGVAIAAEHRASGAGGELMRSTLADLHADGFALSALYPATQPVYRRAGYEAAGSWIGYALGTSAIDVRDRASSLRPAGRADRDHILRAYRQRARLTSGNLERSPQQWDALLPDDNEALRRYVVTDAGRVDGYIVFTQSSEAGGTMACRDLVALTPEAGRRLLTFMADHRSQIGTVRWRGGVADPLQYLLAEQSCSVTSRMLWMLRIVDVRGALEQRGYPEGLDCELHLDVRDDVLGWNHGRFVLSVSGGTAKVRKGGRGRLSADIRGLSPLYTGLLSAAELQVTGLVEGARRDLDAATRIFGGPSPWMPDFF